jgi:pyruvate formate lyase activating enzyme
VHRALDGRHAVDRIACVACGRCVQACPAGALKVVGELWDVPRLVREVQRDRRYYDSSGGGVTLSGGEPTAQFDFCLEALRAFRAAAIHTCLETAGYLAQDELERISEFVDLFLFDYKATDPLRHKELTGVSNVHERKNILSNVEFLLSRGAAVILRCPLVPGVNDSAEHMRGITGLAAKHPSLKGVEIMAYHNMGRDKAIQVGQQAGELDIKTADESVQQAHLQTLRDLGCANVTLG